MLHFSLNVLSDGLLMVYHIYYMIKPLVIMPHSPNILMLKLVKIKVILYANVTRWLNF